MNLLFDTAGPATGRALSLRLKRLRLELLAAKLALGERMYLARIDDGRVGAILAALDQRIRRAEAARLPLGPLLTLRRDLLLRLAAAALEEDAPLPGAQAEYERAREALAAFQEEEGKVVRKRLGPVPVGT